jgi:prevent-host-death family protein
MPRKRSAVPEVQDSKRRPVTRVGVSAATFKATCLELMDRVRETGEEFIVTKHGRPVAKLVPYHADERAGLLGSMRGTVLKYERPFDPVAGEYDVDQD